MIYSELKAHSAKGAIRGALGARPAAWSLEAWVLKPLVRLKFRGYDCFVHPEYREDLSALTIGWESANRAIERIAFGKKWRLLGLDISYVRRRKTPQLTHICP